MATLSTTIRQTLEADATLTAILTGGIFDAAELDKNGLNASISGLYTNEQLNPCLVIRWRGAIPYGPHYTADRRSERQFFELYFYEENGNANIDAAIRRCKLLLDRTQRTADNVGLCWVNWVNDMGEGVADELGGASMNFSRYEVMYTRR